MSISLHAEPLPLTIDPDNVILISHTRVTLETVIGAFLEGVTPEEIKIQYPVLDLADIYAVVGHYLRHQSEIDQYLRTRKQHHDAMRATNEQRHNSAGLRARLLARRQGEDT